MMSCRTVNYGYDDVHRLTSETVTDVYQVPETLNLQTHYDYDELGNRTTQVDANQHTTSFAYGSMGRRSSRSLPLGQSESYT